MNEIDTHIHKTLEIKMKVKAKSGSAILRLSICAMLRELFWDEGSQLKMALRRSVFMGDLMGETKITV